MSRPRAIACVLAWLLSGGTTLHAQVQVGTHFPAAIKTPLHYTGVIPPAVHESRWSYTLTHPGATYIAIHYQDFDLGPGDTLLVSDAQGGQSYTLAGRGKMQAGTFWGRHIKGDTAVLHLIVVSESGGAGFRIDEYVAGNDAFLDPWLPSAICGDDDRGNAVCYENTHSAEYQHSRSVARLLIAGSGSCTGSLVSPFNHVLTNNHCIRHPQDALNTDFDFMAEAPSCATPNCSLCFPGVLYSGSALVQTNKGLDYSLVRLQDGDAAADFGYLEIDNRLPVVGEQVYLPQHSGGQAKMIAIFSSHPADSGGVARINSINADTCLASSGLDEIGYYADGYPGSSGSPLLATATHRIIGLHHCGGCLNRAVPAWRIYPEIERYITGTEPLGGIAPACLAVTASSSADGHGPARAIDQTLTTGWISSAGSGSHWLQLDLGLLAPVRGFNVHHSSAGGGPATQNTRAFEIQSAPAAGGPWTTEFVGDNASQAPVSHFAYTAIRTLRHVRLLISDPGDQGAAHVREFEVLSAPVMFDAMPTGTNVAPASTAVQASSQYNADLGGAKAVDGLVTLSSRWVSANVLPPHTLSLDLGTVRTVSGFIFRQASNVESSAFNARAFSFQSARSLSGPWQTESLVITFGNQHFDARTFVTPKDLRYVRLSIAEPNGQRYDNYARVPEFEVIAWQGGLQASFVAALTGGSAPLSVQFTDLSVGSPTAWSWDFGDGVTSTQQHPQHTYTSAGSYSVTLTVTGPGGHRTLARNSYIQVDVAGASVDFAGQPTSGYVPMAVEFLDLTPGSPTQWWWDFGDGVVSHLQHPSHTYWRPGRYTVRLTVNGPDGEFSRERSSYIHVLTVPADFDEDGDVDQADFGFLQTCLSGAGAPPGSPDCFRADLDGDQDVDAADLAILHRCLSGPDVFIDPLCLQ